ncbi:Amidohydrolase [uncultured archaeon]|nr:Amidohydrolase [uncultured archaeon]
MKVFDAHAHIGKDYFYYKIRNNRVFNMPLKKLVKLMKSNGVEKTIVSQCPSIKEITCCSPTDLIKKGKYIESTCPKCNRIVSVSKVDPYRKYNLRLIKEIEKQNLNGKIIPFFVIHLQNPFFKEEIDFYLKNYKNFGIKFHTYASKRSVLDILPYINKLKVPILIHTGPEKFTDPKNVIEFAKQYPGKVLMAHSARLSKKYLQEINFIENLFVDITPLTSFYNRIINQDFSTILENKESFQKIKSPQDLYTYLLENVSYQKLLFGTDIPWCNYFGKGYAEEIKILLKLNVDTDIKEHLAFKNFEKFLS